MIDKNRALFNAFPLLQRIAPGMAVLFLVLCAGCGSSPYPPVPEWQRNIDVDYDYVLGPGDSVSVFVWGDEELSSMGAIRPDGKFSTRLVEDIQASGKTSTQLARDIEMRYAEYVRQPVVSVTVGGFVGVPEQSVRVVGEAVEPKRIPYSKHMRLIDLMIQAGGLTPYADGNKSVLVRVVDGEEITYSLRLDDLIRDGDISADMAVMPGDILIIAESWF